MILNMKRNVIPIYIDKVVSTAVGENFEQIKSVTLVDSD